MKGFIGMTLFVAGIIMMMGAMGTAPGEEKTLVEIIIGFFVGAALFLWGAVLVRSEEQ